jgi:hypothetical protein
MDVTTLEVEDIGEGGVKKPEKVVTSFTDGGPKSDQKCQSISVVYFILFIFYIRNVCFIKNCTKLSSVFLLCLVRFFMKQMLVESWIE